MEIVVASIRGIIQAWNIEFLPIPAMEKRKLDWRKENVTEEINS